MGLIDNIRTLFTGNSSKKIDKRGLSLNTIFPDADVFDSDKALTLTSVWNAIRLLSESVSSLPISVYRKENNGDKVEDVNHRIYNLIKFKPNNFQNKITFFEYIMYSILTDGNAYVQIIRDNSANPVQLLPMNPDYVNIFIKDNELFYQKDGGPALDSSDVLHIKLITN